LGRRQNCGNGLATTSLRDDLEEPVDVLDVSIEPARGIGVSLENHGHLDGGHTGDEIQPGAVEQPDAGRYLDWLGGQSRSETRSGVESTTAMPR
jgi:hypothetical protein